MTENSTPENTNQPVQLLDTYQSELYNALKTCDSRLSDMYLGGLMALNKTEKPENLVHCSQSMRELMVKLPEYKAGIYKSKYNLTEEISELKKRWTDTSNKSNSLNDGQWTGGIDQSLSRFLTRFEAFLTKYDENRPSRRELFVIAHTEMGPFTNNVPEKISR